MWFRVDDRFYLHPKARAAGFAALGAWLLLGSAAADLDEDGFVPMQLARGLVRSEHLKQLVTVGLLERNGAGYMIHDWSDCHRPMTEAERQRRYRSRKASRDTSRNVSQKVRKRVPTTDDPVLAPEDDDRRPRDVAAVTSSSSSSMIDHVITIAARAIGLQANNQATGYVRGIERNLRAERSDEIAALLAADPDPVRAAGTLVGSQVYARQSARELTRAGTRESTRDSARQAR